MAAILSFASIIPLVNSKRQCVIFRQNYGHKIYRIRCNGENPKNDSPTTEEFAPENALLKVARYGSELLGIAASFLRSPSNVKEAAQDNLKLGVDGSGAIDRTEVVQTIKDYFERSYFITGT